MSFPALDQLDKKLPIGVVMWLFPVVFIIHDAEEILTMESFLRSKLMGLHLPEAVSGLLNVTTPEFIVGVLIILAAILAVTFFAAKSPRPGLALDAYMFLILVFLANGFVHILQAFAFFPYTPGVITSIVVLIPFTLYAMHRTFQVSPMSKKRLAAFAICALALQPVVIVILTLAKALV